MKNRTVDWIVILMGIIFLFAAIYRIFYYQAGLNELSQLNLPAILLPFIIAFEFIVGILFILDKKVCYAAIASIIFLTSAVLIAIISNFKAIIKNLPELFVFNATPTDILLHIIYIVLLALIFIKYKNKQ